MAKPKKQNMPNKALQGRISYMHQAATILASIQHTPSIDSSTTNSLSTASTPESTVQLARTLLHQAQIVSQKTKIRLSQSMKHTICKRCTSLLIDDKTVSSIVENKSRHGRKPWADVLIRTCLKCGCQKRFPCGDSKRQLHRKKRDVVITEDNVKAIPGDDTPDVP